MYIIAFQSIFAVSLLIERLLNLKIEKILPSALIDKANDLVSRGEIKEAQALCDENNSQAASLFSIIIQKSSLPFPVLKESAEEEGRFLSAGLEKNLGAISLIASTAPLLGILGTVVGMIVAFKEVTVSGTSSPLEMADGVWQALLTTGFGLIVGILALVAHRYLLSKVDLLTLKLEKESSKLIDLLIHKK